MKLAFVAFASLLCITSARAGDESLLPMRTVPTGISSYGQLALVAADFDGNGRPELVSLNHTEGPSFMDVLNVGPQGDVLSQLTKQINLGSYAAAGDFDGDGFEDLALSYYWSHVYIYRGGPSGVPTLWQSIELPPPADGLHDIEVADFNDDGWPDILVCKDNASSTSPFKLLRNLGGSAGFSVQTALAASGMQPSMTAVSDLNGDGRLDVLANEFDTDLVRVLLANFSGVSFSSTTSLPMAGNVGDICALDLTADGVPDMAVSILGPASGITCQAGTGGGSFGAALHTLAADGRADLDTGDIDSDGDVDIVQAGEDAGVYAWTNSGALPLLSPPSIHTQPDTQNVLMADVNGDGWDDLAANPYWDRGITLVYGGPQGLQVPAASLLVDNATSVHAADFTGDGLVDVLGVGNQKIRLAAGNGNGTLDPATNTNAFNALQSTFGLLNGDALPDVLLLIPSGPRLKLMLNLGASQQFQSGDDQLMNAGPVAAPLVADIDGDGAVEICVPTNDGQMRMYHVDGSSQIVSLGSVPVPEIVGLTQNPLYPMATGDVNADGLLDVAFAAAALDQVFVFPGQPGGMLAPAEILDVSVEKEINQALLGDVNEDGLDDVLGRGWNTSFGTTVLWPSLPGLQFAAPQTIVGGWYQPHLADLNADGHLDLVSFRGQWLGEPSHVAVQLGFGNGQFAAPAKFSSELVHLDVADFSSDGVPDALTLADFPEIGGLNSDEASVFVSRPFTPFADLGNALGGIKGEPEFLAWGWLKPGQTATLSVARAKPLAQSALFIGLSQGLLPFKGGTLVPSPDLLLPAFVTDSKGSLEVSLLWPASVPSTLTFTMQWWFADATGPKGFTASNALSATTP